MYYYDHYPYRPNLYYPPYSHTTVVEAPKKRPLRLIAPNTKVSPDDVKSFRMAEGNTHVILDFDTHSVELDPSYTYAEIDAALHGLCYYRTKWTDEVGDIDVCVLHDQNSEYPESDGPFRRCLNNDFWAKYWKAELEAINARRDSSDELDKNHSVGVVYEEPKKRSLWARILGK